MGTQLDVWDCTFGNPLAEQELQDMLEQIESLERIKKAISLLIYCTSGVCAEEGPFWEWSSVLVTEEFKAINEAMITIGEDNV